MPASRDYIPAGDADLLAWATNYSALITISPTTYGLVAGDATATAAALTTYSTALTAATNPATRTSVTVATKDTARANLVALCRSQVDKIQATTTVTPTQKTNLGITVRITTRTPVPPPASRPILSVVRSNGPVLDMRINDELTPDSLALPTGVVLCQVFMRQGATGGSDLANYDLLATTGRCVNQFDVSSVPSGTTMHFLARWLNRRGQPGPLSEVATQIRTA